MCIRDRSRHSEEAASLANYIGSADFIEEFMAAGAIPVLNSVAKELVPELGYPENNQIFYESASTAKAVQMCIRDRVCSHILSFPLNAIEDYIVRFVRERIYPSELGMKISTVLRYF